MSYVNPAFRWMHLSHVHTKCRPGYSLRLLRSTHHVWQRPCVRLYSALSNVSDQPKSMDSASTSVVEGQQTDLLDSKFQRINSESTGPRPTIPLNFKMLDTETRTESLGAGERDGKKKPVWALFDAQIDRLPSPFAEDSRTGPVPFLKEKFQNIFARVFSRLMSQHAGGADLAYIRKHNEIKIRNAEILWKSHGEPAIREWLNDEMSLYKRCDEIVTLLAGSLLISPNRFLQVLAALRTLDDDFQIRASSLYAAWVLHRNELESDKSLMQEFDGLVNQLRPSHRWPKAPLSYEIVVLFCLRSDKAQFLELLHSLSMKYTSLSRLSILRLAQSCITHGMVDQGFTCLSCLPDSAFQNPDDNIYRTCMELLRHDTVVEINSGHNFRYLSHMLERGLPPNGFIYDRIIKRAIECGYSGVAWDVYYHTKSAGVPLSPHTYVWLLRDAFLSRKRTDLNEILSQIQRRKELYDHRGIILYSMNMIRKLYRTQFPNSPSEGLLHVLSLYDRIWSREPLIRLGVAPEAPHSASDKTLTIPDTYSLCFTIFSCVGCFAPGDEYVTKMWDKLIDMARRGDETVLQCMQVDLLYNAFIIVNTANQSGASRAIEVLQFMIEQQYCLPTSRTWSILICGFLRLNRDAEAQQIHSLMSEFGFKLDQIHSQYFPRGATVDDLRERIDAVLSEDEILHEMDGRRQQKKEDDPDAFLSGLAQPEIPEKESVDLFNPYFQIQTDSWASRDARDAEPISASNAA